MNNKIVNNVFWRFLESCSTELVSFVVSIVLARILLPSDYASVTIVMVFINILTVFVNGGAVTSLIQKKDANNKDFSTIFYFNLLTSIVIYTVLYFVAPVISKYYKMPDLIAVIRSMSLLLIIVVFKNVQYAYAAKQMMFKKFFYSSLIGTVISAIIGVIMAKNGFGTWALVFQQLLDALIDAIILWFSVGWRPKNKFSKDSFSELFGFGSKMFISQIINKIFSNLNTLAIGKKYAPTDLSFYNKGSRLPELVISNVNTSIDSVLLPAMSEIQDSKIKMKEMTKKSIKLSTFIIFPLMFGMIAVSKNFILIFYTEKWLECVPYLCIFSFSNMLYPFQTSNLNSIKALGRSDIFLIVEIIKKVLTVLMLLLTIRISVVAMALGSAIISVVSIAINALPNKKLINYSILEQIKDVSKSFILGLFMCFVVYYIGNLEINIYILFVIQILVGIIIYIVGCIIFKLDEYENVLNICKYYLSKNKCKASKHH